jgi:hypothetical protein
MSSSGSRPRGLAEDDDAPRPQNDASVVDVTLRLPVGTVRALLDRELSTLAEERAAHAADVAAYDSIKARVAVTHFSTYIKLDVGGALFKTSASTLRAERGSTLAGAKERGDGRAAARARPSRG